MLSIYKPYQVKHAVDIFVVVNISQGAYSLFYQLCLFVSDVDDVHEMMDDIQEQTELADEISRAISEPAGFGMDVDEVSRIIPMWF